ncbi:MAG: hypothetical protein U0796_10500 [Gemmatales bacterium]
MSQLKPITRGGVPAALEKAKQYRVLNEPAAAESICQDILCVDDQHEEARITLLLALTDQFEETLNSGAQLAKEVLYQLKDPYHRAYYHGLICERQALSHLKRGAPQAGYIAYEWLEDAMHWYQAAEAIRPAGNDDAILRWNTCVRLLERHPEIKPRLEETYEPSLE